MGHLVTRAIFAALIGAIMVSTTHAGPTEVQVIGPGNKVPGVYNFGPIPLPDTATHLRIVIDRGNLFTRPETVQVWGVVEIDDEGFVDGPAQRFGCRTPGGVFIDSRTGQPNLTPMLCPGGNGQPLLDRPNREVRGHLEVIGGNAAVNMVIIYETP